MLFSTDILIIMFAPFVVLMLFQLSSYLNQTILPTGMATMEIEDFSEITGIPENRIRITEEKNNNTIFKVFDIDLKTEIGEIIFNNENLKVQESRNIVIENDKLQNFRRKKFARIINADEKDVKITEDGNTFTQVKNKDGEEIIIGSVTFDENNEPVKITGKFKKFF